jgi:hypothetical protein
VLKKSAVPVDPAVTIVVQAVLLPTVPRHVVHVVLWAPMPRRLTAATNRQKLVVLKPLNPPLSAFAQSPRQLQQLTAKENNYVATRSSQIPQRAKRP